MKRDELIAYLREYADWASSGKWVTPICLSDHLTKAANVIEEYEEREGQEMSINQENDQSLRHNNICGELHELYRKKNHDYGDSFHKGYEEFGLTMAAIRISDKVNRFKTLIKSVRQCNDESIRDTLLDTANYCIMTVMELDRERDNW